MNRYRVQPFPDRTARAPFGNAVVPAWRSGAPVSRTRSAVPATVRANARAGGMPIVASMPSTYPARTGSVPASHAGLRTSEIERSGTYDASRYGPLGAMRSGETSPGAGVFAGTTAACGCARIHGRSGVTRLSEITSDSSSGAVIDVIELKNGAMPRPLDMTRWIDARTSDARIGRDAGAPNLIPPRRWNR